MPGEITTSPKEGHIDSKANSSKANSSKTNSSKTNIWNLWNIWKLCLNIWNLWNQFWFAPRDLYVLSLFRMGLGATLLVMYFTRFLEIELFYFNEGMVDTEVAKLYYNEFNRPLFYLFPSTNGLIYLLHVLFLLGLFFIVLGISNRFFVLVIFFFHLCFIQRNHFIVYGADLYATFYLFFLCFMKTGVHFNFITWVRKRWFGFSKKVETCNKMKACNKIDVYDKVDTYDKSDLLTSVGVRLVQVQICISYGMTGLEKLKGPQWWEGSAVWYVIGNQQLVPMDLSLFYHWPALVAIMSASVIAFEVYFPMAIWQKKLFPLWIGFGVLFHIAAALFMGIPYFSLVVIWGYLLWFRREDFSKFQKNAK